MTKKVIDLREYFEPRIISRGYDYYESGFINYYSEQDNEISAVVEGTEDYTVNILVDGHGSIIDLMRDCPSAEDGHSCKHMAAVLIHYNELVVDPDFDFDSSEDDTVDNRREMAEVIIENLKPTETKEILLEYLLKRPYLIDERYAKIKPESLIEDYEEKKTVLLENVRSYLRESLHIISEPDYDRWNHSNYYDDDDDDYDNWIDSGQYLNPLTNYVSLLIQNGYFVEVF